MTDLFTFAEESARRRPTIEEARAAADVGMQQALDHAESVTPDWRETAYRFLVVFAGDTERFISEDVSDASKRAGMAQPPTDRAWGSVYKRAIKDCVIVQDGTGRSRRRHASICPMWRSLVYRGPA